MKSKILAAAVVAAFSLGAAAQAGAGTVVLTFDQLNGGVNEAPLNFYAGGTGSAGTGPGPNYGITFSSNAITGCEAGAPCANTNSSLNPSSPNELFFLSGAADTMDVAAGFSTGFSFFYSAIGFPGFVNVWSGLDGTGTLLAHLDLPLTPTSGDPGCLAPYCPYVPVGVSFSGVAQSVDFGGSADFIAFDNITLGADVPGGVPEPATWAMMLMGFGGLGVAIRSKRRKQVAATA